MRHIIRNLKSFVSAKKSRKKHNVEEYELKAQALRDKRGINVFSLKNTENTKVISINYAKSSLEPNHAGDLQYNFKQNTIILNPNREHNNINHLNYLIDEAIYVARGKNTRIYVHMPTKVEEKLMKKIGFELQKGEFVLTINN
jgi:hypothetical protein